MILGLSFIVHGLIGGHSAHFDGLVQDYSNSSALAMELRQSCTKPTILSIYSEILHKDIYKYKKEHILKN